MTQTLTDDDETFPQLPSNVESAIVFSKFLLETLDRMTDKELTAFEEKITFDFIGWYGFANNNPHAENASKLILQMLPAYREARRLFDMPRATPRKHRKMRT